MRELMAVTKALADENRVRTLMALRGGELCVCQITELFGLAPSTISKHLSILHKAGLVSSRKEGRWMYYRIAEGSSEAGGQALRWLEKTLAKNPQIAGDARMLKKILKMDPAALFKQQCQ